MFYFLGYEKRSYINKQEQEVVGYNVFLAKTDDDSFTGYKPFMRFDSVRKSLGFPYLNEKQFNALKIAYLKPFSKVSISFNEFGNFESIKQA